MEFFAMTRSNPLAAAALSSALVGALSLGSAANAQSNPQPQQPDGRGPRRMLVMPKLTPEQQQKLFPDRKALLQREQRERVAILQRSQSCVNRAGTPDALRSCLMQERRDTMAMRQRFQGEMRELFEKNGIDYPQLERKPQRREPAGKPIETI
jgi:Spy/CpxP family protein refolding chaperone